MQLFTSGFSWISGCFSLLVFFKWWWVSSVPLHLCSAVTLAMARGGSSTASTGKYLLAIPAWPLGLNGGALGRGLGTKPTVGDRISPSWSWLKCPQKVRKCMSSVDPAPIGDTPHPRGLLPFSLCGEDSTMSPPTPCHSEGWMLSLLPVTHPALFSHCGFRDLSS